MKNKDLVYLAIAIGGAFLLHKYYMNQTTTPGDKISTPVEPSIPGVIDQEVIKNLVTNDIVSAISHQEPVNEYDVSNTYQNYYIRQINGVKKNCPMFI